MGYTTTGEIINGIVRKRPGYADYLLWDLRTCVLEYAGLKEKSIPLSKQRATSARLAKARTRFMNDGMKSPWKSSPKLENTSKKIRIMDPEYDHPTEETIQILDPEYDDESIELRDEERMLTEYKSRIEELVEKMSRLEAELKEKEVEIDRLRKEKENGKV